MLVVPQLLRRSSILDAISYTFPPDDATGFPEVLPEARKIGLGRRALTGFLTSGQKVEGLGPFESSLERDYFVLLEFDQRVLAWHPQPCRIPVPAGGGKRARHYTPDVAVEYSKAIGATEIDRVELCEIKYREDLKENWSTLKPLLKAGSRYARKEGWRFRIYSEQEIRTPRLWNAKFFLPYQQRGCDPDDIDRLAFSLESLGPTDAAQLLTRCQENTGERGRLIAVLWHMIAKGIVDFDIDQEITMNSRVWLNEQASY